MLDSSIVFVDLETTGANPVEDRVIEIGVVKVTDIDQISAVCAIVSGSGFEVGDMVKTVTQ